MEAGSAVSDILAATEAIGNSGEAIVRCLTLYQPWATLIALRAKTIETRSWRTWYRGDLLIHAARSFPKSARELCAQEPFAKVLAQGGYCDTVSGKVDPAGLPLGAIVAKCKLKHCVRVGTPGVELPPPEPERLFGDYTSGRYAWILADVQALLQPVPAHGSMGLWTPDPTLLAVLERLYGPDNSGDLG